MNSFVLEWVVTLTVVAVGCGELKKETPKKHAKVEFKTGGG